MTAVSILATWDARPGCHREHGRQLQAVESVRFESELGPTTYELCDLEQVISPEYGFRLG